jgi:hypothetical protein
MGPTDIIREWFESESAETQGDIAFLMLSSLSDEPDLLVSLDALIPEMIGWLSPGSEASFRTVGKAVSFMAVFDVIFADRFTPEGWERPRRLFEAALEDAPSESMVETARQSLADMPRKQALWSEVGRRWQAVKARLTPEYLEAWSIPSR